MDKLYNISYWQFFQFSDTHISKYPIFPKELFRFINFHNSIILFFSQKYCPDLSLENKQKNYKIQHQKLETNINQMNESKISLEKEFLVLKEKKEKEEKDFVVLSGKKDETKQELDTLERLLENITGGDERRTR